MLAYICKALKKTLEICESMKEAGADYSIIFTPHYYKKQMTYSALLEYFTRVSERPVFFLFLEK